jgi:hypothetical protein
VSESMRVAVGRLGCAAVTEAETKVAALRVVPGARLAGRLWKVDRGGHATPTVATMQRSS